MLRKSHIVFGIGMLPTFLIYPISNNLSLFEKFNLNLNPIISTIDNWNKFSVNIDTINPIISIGFLATYLIGTITPDIDLKFKFLVKNSNERYKYHRQFTHSLLLTLFLIFSSLYWLPNYTELYPIATGFFLGILTHIIGDMLTGSVPWFIYGHYGIPGMRIGITSFLPKKLHEIFTVKFPKFLDKNLYAVLALALIPLNIRIFLGA